MLEIKNKIEFENKCWIGEVNSSLFNSSEESRINAVTDMASITKGKLGFKLTGTDCTLMIAERKAREDVARKRLYNRLLTESVGKPSAPFEFIPQAYQDELKVKPNEEEINTYYKYSNVIDGIYFSNLRNILSGMYSHMDRQFNSKDQITDFKVIVGKVPYEVIRYLGRKSAFSLICELDNATEKEYTRYLKEVIFWYPSWWENHVIQNTKEWSSAFLNRVSSGVSDGVYKSEEAVSELPNRRLVTFAMCAWKHDVNAWDNLFAVRANNSETINIVDITIKAIKPLIYA